MRLEKNVRRRKRCFHDTLAAKIVYAAEHHYVQPSDFLGVGALMSNEKLMKKAGSKVKEGMMDIPDEKGIQAMMNEVQKNPQKYRYVA